MKAASSILPLAAGFLMSVMSSVLLVEPAWVDEKRVTYPNVTLERGDGGTAQSTTPDENGAFDFGMLEPGDYRLRLAPQAAGRAVNHSSSRSNIRAISNPDGTEQQIIDIEINPREVRPGPDPGIDFTVGPQAARVSGTIVISESGPASRPAMRQLQPRRTGDGDP